jgi:hypothetical protein
MSLDAESDDGEEPFGEKMERLVAELEKQFAETERLETAIRGSLKRVGNGG